jgi:hypothetical protein
MSAGHGPLPVARGCGAALVVAPGLLDGHEPLRVLLAVVVSLLLPLLVCHPGTDLCVLFIVVVSLLLPGYGGHAVQIVPLAVSGR